jgi:hypothetical protein
VQKEEHEMKIVKNTIVASILVGISTGAAIADGKRISGGSYFGCTDKEYRGKLASAAAQEDMEAFKKGLMAGMLRGVCVIFKEGEEVGLDHNSVHPRHAASGVR